MRFTKQFWAGLLAGLGLGLLSGAALVELGLLATSHKAWASVLGIVLFGVGRILAGKPAAPPPDLNHPPAEPIKG
jgi:hypothetical protein